MKTKKNSRKRWFRGLKGFLKIFIRRPKIVYLGGEIEEGSIVLSNHVGKTAPLALELYLDANFRFWGAHEMNEGLKTLYKYQSEIFYHQKLHWNLHLARAFCIIAAPLTYVFYRGLNLISTYPDGRLKHTIQESVDSMNNGQSVIIFPEDSSKGYFDTLTSVQGGFLTLAKTLFKKGVDVSIYLSYYRNKDRTYIVDAPIKYSQIMNMGLSKAEVCKKFCQHINSLREYGIEGTNNG